MAKKNSFNNPIIPKNPGFWETRRIRTHGRKDAKSNRALKDFTKTQAINGFESYSRRGEIALNDWLLRVSAPFVTGNARIEAELALLFTKIDKQKANMGKTGREQKAAALRLAALEQEESDLRSQFASNKETALALIRRADEVKPLWEELYRQKVAIYNQARARKLKVEVEAASAEIPVYKIVEISELDQFNRELPERKTR
jgi:hypothetical protein